MINDEIKYIALDMDGTILDKNYILSREVIHTLGRCREIGKKIVISTGRVYASAIKHTTALTVDGFVCSNGADVYDGAGQPIAQTHMDEALSRRLVDIARGYDTHFHAFMTDSWYYEREKAYTQFYIRRSGLQGNQVNFDNFNKLGFTKCMFLDDHERLEPIRIAVADELKDAAQLMYSAPFMLEIVAKGVNKASGLLSFVKHSGGSLGEVIAFGDAGNDEDMLTAAGIGVAMGNATDELKAKVDFTAPSVDEDGVALFLNSFFGL